LRPGCVAFLPRSFASAGKTDSEANAVSGGAPTARCLFALEAPASAGKTNSKANKVSEEATKQKSGAKLRIHPANDVSPIQIQKNRRTSFNNLQINIKKTQKPTHHSNKQFEGRQPGRRQKPRRSKLGKAIAIFNQKGGVGKTTTNINLAACLAMRGKKILIMDIDPQGNTTSGIGISKKGLTGAMYEILIDENMDPASAIMDTNLETLKLLPASVELAGAEIELVQLEGREKRLKKALDRIRGQFDYVFIDCPPSLGLLTINSLTAVDSVLIPIQCEFYALEGVSQLMSTIDLVKKSLNPKLEIQGVILSMFDGRTNLSIQVVEEVKKYFKEKVYSTVIPRNVRLAEAPSYGMPITEYDPKSKGAEAYMEFAEEFLENENDL
jgi:chromosome partitioning protein